MAEIDETLQLFGFLTLDEVTPDGLRRAFKTNIIRAHPDKGGSPELFDKMLRSYVYLTETVQRVYGGRATLQNIVSPEELKGMRPDEIVNRLFEEFDREAFNKAFEEEQQIHGSYVSGRNDGYEGWLKNAENDTNVVVGKYGGATQKPPSFEEKDLNSAFETEVRQGKPEPAAIILHPEAMAVISGQTIGTAIIDSSEGDYTSAPFLKPEYTDVYSAFTSNNTICDKVPVYTKTDEPVEGLVDTLIAERNKDITPLNDAELKVIKEYEQKKLDNNIANMSKIRNHFNHETNFETSLTNWPPEKYPTEAYNGFVVNL